MHKSNPKQKFTNPCANAIEAFHRALGGRMFRHENLGNGGKVSRPIASECTIGLGPSLTTPQSHETSTNSRMNWFSDSSKYIQFEASKYINGKLED